jgi:S-methylmethionine-dependent homocysteine/selenocysteine methylase
MVLENQHEQIDHTAGSTQTARKERRKQIKWKQKFNKKAARCLGLCVSCNTKYVHVQEGARALEGGGEQHVKDC